MTRTDKEKKAARKRNLIEWGVIGAGILFLYTTGLHTQVIGTMQRTLLWTGLMDAKPTEVQTDGPFLTDEDYRFIMATHDDVPQTLSEMQGDVIFVNIWASWCPPCIAEMPTIETLYSELKGHENIQFLLLSMDEERERATQFMEKRGFTVPYHFPASPVPSPIHSTLLPTTYVISKEGQVVYEKRGIADYSNPVFRNWLVELSKK